MKIQYYPEHITMLGEQIADEIQLSATPTNDMILLIEYLIDCLPTKARKQILVHTFNLENPK